MIETERLILRPVAYEDAESIYAYASDAETTKWVTFDTYKSIEDAYWALDNFFLNRNPEEWFEALAIVDKESGRMIGTIDASRVRPNNSVEIGYIMHKDFWNKGIMSEAVKAYCIWLFEEKGIRRLELTHIIENIGSKNVALKNGFVFEGIRRDYGMENGKHVDLPYYSLLERDIKK